MKKTQQDSFYGLVICLSSFIDERSCSFFNDSNLIFVSFIFYVKVSVYL